MHKIINKRKRTDAETAPVAHSPRQRCIETPSSIGLRLCRVCDKLDFDDIFDVEEDASSKAIFGRCLVRQLPYERQHPNEDEAAKCDFCRLLIDGQPEHQYKWRRDVILSAYSTRAAFHIPQGLIPDRIMIAVLPDRWTGGIMLERPLEKTHLIMECDDNLTDGIVGRRIRPQVDYGLVASWLDFCSTHHGRLCQKENIDGMPGFSVIDCSERKVKL
jgi:hypothetical protein